MIKNTSLLLSLCFLMVACGGGGSSSSSSSSVNNPTNPPTENPEFGDGFPRLATAPSNNDLMTSCTASAAVPASSTITGRVEYQHVPVTNRGLEYRNTEVRPARGLIVQAVAAQGNDCSDTVVASAITNNAGDYGLVVPANDAVCVEVRAQLFRDDSGAGASWNFQVLDNTNDGAPYYLIDNPVPETPANRSQRNFLAASGANVGSSDYTSERAAAPFAILAAACEVLDTLVTVDANIELPPLFFYWSGNNLAASGNLEDGEIGGSFYRHRQLLDSSNQVVSESHEIYLLGDEDNNTDEYDLHVITHEMGHFITGALSRSDSIGGQHFLDDHLDMRVAFDEGFADAFSAIALEGAVENLNDQDWIDTPKLYRDSLGVDQANAFSFSMDRNFSATTGWYSERTAFYTVFNLYDTLNDGITDSLSLGFAPLYNVLVSNAYQQSDAFITLFTFINQLKQQYGEPQAIDILLAEQDTEQILDDYGSGESIVNNDVVGIADLEPFYHPLALNTATTVCSNDQFGLGNKLSVFQFLRFNATVERSYRFELSSSDSLGQGSLDIYQKGRFISGVSASSEGDDLTQVINLSGETLLVVADLKNADAEGIQTGRRCFEITVE